MSGAMDRDDLPDIGLPRTQSERLDHEASISSLPSVMLYNDGTFDHEANVESSVDDFSARTHDQLPAVETYKATQADPVAKNKSRRLKIMIAGALSIVFVCVFVTIGVVIGKKESKSATAAAPSTNTGNVPPSGAVPTVMKPGQVSRVAQVVTFVSTTMGWTNATTINDVMSAQYKAATWIADVDSLKMPLENSEEFRSRYVLAVFYYATLGHFWDFQLNFLSADHVCLWQADYPGLSGQQIKVGVQCDDSAAVVIKLFFPTLGLQGKMPPEIRLLTGLQELDLYNNDISGTIPDELQQLVELTSLVMSSNVFSGQVPTWFSMLPKLETIDLSVLGLTGQLPTNLGDLAALTTLNLEHNNLHGNLDPLSNLKTIKFLALGDNLLTGGLSDDLLVKWTYITDLDLSHNLITGNLPQRLFSMENLYVIDLNNNGFVGQLPSTIHYGSAVKFLALYQNHLSGNINGSFISALSHLNHLDLSLNWFEGDLPSEIGRLNDLKYLFLAYNTRLTAGHIPPEWATLTKLVDLSLQKTNRIGKIPSQLGRLKDLVLLDLLGNNLTGEIPAEIGGMQNLTFLLLKDNHLNGIIPESMAYLTNLDTVVIDKNDLMGGASNLCPLKLKALTVFISDCNEVNCTCCTLCCSDAQSSCDNSTWFSQQDPVINYQYERVAYKFNQDDIIYPVAAAANTSNLYNDFGISQEGVP